MLDLVTVTPEEFADLRASLPAITDRYLFDVFGISEFTWVKLRKGCRSSASPWSGPWPSASAGEPWAERRARRPSRRTTRCRVTPAKAPWAMLRVSTRFRRRAAQASVLFAAAVDLAVGQVVDLHAQVPGRRRTGLDEGRPSGRDPIGAHLVETIFPLLLGQHRVDAPTQTPDREVLGEAQGAFQGGLVRQAAPRAGGGIDPPPRGCGGR